MKSLKDTTIVVLLAAVLFLSVFSFAGSKVSKGTPTNFDVSATVASLKTLDAELDPEISNNIRLLHVIMQYSAQLPDSIYGDLLAEYYRRDNLNKCHYLRVKIYEYLHQIQNNPPEDKVYVFSGTSTSLKETPKFIVFHKVKRAILKISSVYTVRDYKVQVRLRQASGVIIDTVVVEKKVNGPKEYTLNFSPSWGGDGELYLDIDPPEGTTTWQLSIPDTNQ